MTLQKFTNKFIFQWFGIRLTKHIETITSQYSVHDLVVLPNGETESVWTDDVETKTWYSLQYFILPLSGWNNDFVYLTKEPKFVRISKVKSTVDKVIL